MDETRLRTTEQLEEFLGATPEVVFAAPGAGRVAENQRYEHISHMLTSGLTTRGATSTTAAWCWPTSDAPAAMAARSSCRLVARWAENRAAQHPLLKQYRAPAAPVARKYAAADLGLVVEMDSANEDACGAAIAQQSVRDQGSPR